MWLVRASSPCRKHKTTANFALTFELCSKKHSHCVPILLTAKDWSKSMYEKTEVQTQCFTEQQ